MGSLFEDFGRIFEKNLHRLQKWTAMRSLLIVFFLFLTCLNVEALKNSVQAKCEVEAEILSISDGKYYWNKDEFYQYFDIGILIKNIKPLEKSDALLTCTPLKEEKRTDIVRIWDWNNKDIAWIYENQKPMAPHDNVKLQVTNSYVGDGNWPTIIGVKLIDSSKQ